jgi:hypothetical protein
MHVFAVSNGCVNNPTETPAMDAPVTAAANSLPSKKNV